VAASRNHREWALSVADGRSIVLITSNRVGRPRARGSCRLGDVDTDDGTVTFVQSRERGVSMAWNLQGSFYENCSCDAICPCTWSNLAHRATRDYCRFALAFQVDSGEIEGVNVSGHSFVLIGDTPPDMAQGNWRLGVFVDDDASSEQVSKLGQVLSGELGGPLAALGPLLDGWCESCGQ
jgi:hypothetical protein